MKKIDVKSPPNAPETQEITTPRVNWAGWTILLDFSTFWGQFKISHAFLYMTVSHSLGYCTCDLTQVCLFVCICSCYTDDSLCGLQGIKTIQTCTPTTKPICGKCESGQYFSKGVDGCMPCSPPCTALQTEVQSCSHEHNRVCQPRPPSTPDGIITLTYSHLPLSTQGLSSVCISNSKNIPTRNNINVQ